MITLAISNSQAGPQDRQQEKGNVLFLILIAVALFAALSYAVTQSTRSGGGDASRETNLVNSSQITQYPASIKTAIVRMIVSNSISPDTLQFNQPSAFGSLTTVGQGVFHPSGGGANYQLAPTNVTSVANQAWVFNMNNQILNIGTNGTAAANDIIAFLPNVRAAICNQIHTQLGLVAPPVDSGIDVTTQMVNGYAVPGAAGPVINGTGANELDSQPQGCFQQPSGTYYYYHVLVER